MILRRTAYWLGVLALLGALLGGQSLAFASGGASGTNAYGRTLNDTGSTYLTGVRIFAAEVLWNRIDPILDAYYKGVPLEDMKYMVPTLRAVVWLDPHFVSSYYISTWILAKNHLVAESLATAREAVANNPRSALMRIAYAQILSIYVHQPQAAADQAEFALRPDAQWRDATEQHDNLRLAQDIFTAAGRTADVKATEAVLLELATQPTSVTTPISQPGVATSTSPGAAPGSVVSP